MTRSRRWIGPAVMAVTLAGVIGLLAFLVVDTIREDAASRPAAASGEARPGRTAGVRR